MNKRDFFRITDVTPELLSMTANGKVARDIMNNLIDNAVLTERTGVYRPIDKEINHDT